MFKMTEWNTKPPQAQKLAKGGYLVTRKVEAVERDGATVYVGEAAFMSETQYAAYVGAQEAEAKREAAVIDDYTLALIEEGVL